MPNLETRLARLEQGLPDGTVLREGFAALRRLVTSGQMNADDVATYQAMLNHRTLEQQLKGLTDAELHEGIQLLQARVALNQGAFVPDSTSSGVTTHVEH